MRLIDADEVIQTVNELMIVDKTVMGFVLMNAPTVDAVPVVRCKDCKWWKTAEGVNLSKRVKFCTYHIGHQYARHDDDFCSRCERKDGEQHGTK